MYRRMEDERLAHIRGEQTTRVAKRSELCEVAFNENATDDPF